MSKSFKEMTTEELREYMNQHTEDESGELAFMEYRSRLNWNHVSANISSEEEKDIFGSNATTAKVSPTKINKEP